MVPDCWIYIYHLDHFYNLPVTPETLPNTYQVTYNTETLMNRTSPKITYSGSGPRTLSVSLVIHTQMFQLDNPDITENVTKALINDLIACAYPQYNPETSEIVPPMVLLKFGEISTIRGVVSGQINCSYEGPWLKDGTRAVANITFPVIERDQFSAEYISQFGSNPQIPFDLERRNIYVGKQGTSGGRF